MNCTGSVLKCSGTKVLDSQITRLMEVEKLFEAVIARVHLYFTCYFSMVVFNRFQKIAILLTITSISFRILFNFFFENGYLKMDIHYKKVELRCFASWLL